MTTQTEAQIATLGAQLRKLQDAEAVRQLMAEYHLACDGWDERGTHRVVDAIAALFTPDGVWDVPTQEEGVFAGGGRTLIAGREAIAEFARGLQSIHWIIHFVVNPVVAIDGDTASADFKGFVRFKSSDGDPGTWVCGLYRTEARRTSEGWRFNRLAWDHLDTL